MLVSAVERRRLGTNPVLSGLPDRPPDRWIRGGYNSEPGVACSAPPTSLASAWRKRSTLRTKAAALGELGTPKRSGPARANSLICSKFPPLNTAGFRRFAAGSVHLQISRRLGIESFAETGAVTATKLLWIPLTVSIPLASGKTARRRAEPLDGITLDSPVGYDIFTNEIG